MSVDTADRLAQAPMSVVGQFASASNVTLLCHVGDGPPPEPDAIADAEPGSLAVYKPRDGEAPLWDFPEGTLYRREVAAFVVDRMLGWGLVPVTVVRDDGPLGPGCVQAFVPHDPGRHYFWLREHGSERVLRQLHRMVLFDLVIDNADRKGGHVLLGDAGIQLVDHGVSFHVEKKLRTVAWDFAGDAVAPDDAECVARLATGLAEDSSPLSALLTPAEIARLRERATETAALRRYPQPLGARPFPWPLL